MWNEAIVIPRTAACLESLQLAAPVVTHQVSEASHMSLLSFPQACIRGTINHDQVSFAIHLGQNPAAPHHQSHCLGHCLQFLWGEPWQSAAVSAAHSTLIGAMDKVLPVAEAVLMGTVDSIENFAINIRDKLPKFGQQQDRFPCMNGKVRPGDTCLRSIHAPVKWACVLAAPAAAVSRALPWTAQMGRYRHLLSLGILFEHLKMPYICRSFRAVVLNARSAAGHLKSTAPPYHNAR